MVDNEEPTEQNAEPLFSRSKAPWLIVTGLVVLLCIYVRVRLLNVPLERDEGEFAYFAQLMLRGIPPYLDAYSLKLPGAALVYALFMLLFGQSAWGIHLGLLLVNLASVVLLFFLARRLFTREAAATAAAAYAVLSLSQGVHGVFAHATHFVVLFALTGFLLLMKALKSGRTFPLFCSGLSFGLAILMKQHGIFFALFALLYLLWERRDSLAGGWRRLAGEGMLFVAATGIPFGVCCLLLYLYGTFDTFWFWTFKYAREYVSRVPLHIGVKLFLIQFAKVSQASLLLWIAAGIGMYFLFAKGDKRGKAFAAGLFFSSFLAVCPGFYFREHYFIMLLPAIALLNGIAVGSAGELFARRYADGYSRWIPALLFLTVTLYSIHQERGLFFFMDPVAASRAIYKTNPFPESARVAQYIKDRTAADDRIAVLGSEPQIYFHAERLSATGHIYMYGLMENQRYAPVMQQQLIREVEAARPKFIAVVNVSSSWLIRQDSYMLLFDWAKSYLAENYVRSGVVDILPNETIYRWDSEAIGYAPRSQSFVEVYKRKRS